MTQPLRRQICSRDALPCSTRPCEPAWRQNLSAQHQLHQVSGCIKLLHGLNSVVLHLNDSAVDASPEIVDGRYASSSTSGSGRVERPCQAPAGSHWNSTPSAIRCACSYIANLCHEILQYSSMRFANTFVLLQISAQQVSRDMLPLI